MNISCIICSDFLNQRAQIYSTSCGHLFHYMCLIQWIEQSRTCPQCRHKETENSIHKIYLTVTNPEGIQDDLVTLQTKLDNSNFTLTLKDNEVRNLKESCGKYKAKALGLRDMVKKLEDDIRVRDSALRAEKEQIIYFKNRAKEVDKLTGEVVRLKKELKGVAHLQTMMSGCQEQVDEMLRNNKDPQSLCLLVTTLKKELIETDRRKQKLSSQLLTVRNDIFKANGEVDRLRAENQRLITALSDHNENCAREKGFLKKKLAELCGVNEGEVNETLGEIANNTLDRIILESPAPKPVDFNEGVIDLSEINSPTIAERVNAIRDSDSPYLTIKPSGSGISNLLKANYKIVSNNQGQKQRANSDLDKFSLFNKSLTSQSQKNKGEYSYNGLGGHSKEDKYPQPQSSNTLKRVKSSSSLRPSKFKKLNPGCVGKSREQRSETIAETQIQNNNEEIQQDFNPETRTESNNRSRRNNRRNRRRRHRNRRRRSQVN